MKLICMCSNPHCKDCNKETEIDWDGVSTAYLSSLLKCSSCGEKKIVTSGKGEHQADKLSTIATPTIDGMTPAQRKALLKKRSTDDFHRNIEDRKREMDANIIPR